MSVDKNEQYLIMKAKKKKSLKRELIEWGVFLGIIGVLFITGWHKNLIAGVQSLVVKTGIIQAKIKSTNAQPNALYNFQLMSLDGKVLNFESLKGKTVFMNLWATWCPPCIAEMPDIHRLYKEVGSDQIQFVMLSLDKDPKKAAKFIQRKGYKFPVYTQQGYFPVVYDSRSIPATFVISPQGKIVVKHTGIASYNTQKFKKLLTKVAQSPPAKN